jgi:hypothetical protein
MPKIKVRRFTADFTPHAITCKTVYTRKFVGSNEFPLPFDPDPDARRRFRRNLVRSNPSKRPILGRYPSPAIPQQSVNRLTSERAIGGTE